MLYNYRKQRKFQNVLRTWEVSVFYYLKYRIKKPEFFFSRYFSYFSLTLTNKYLHRVIIQPRKLFKPLVLARAISFPNFDFRKINDSDGRYGSSLTGGTSDDDWLHRDDDGSTGFDDEDVLLFSTVIISVTLRLATFLVYHYRRFNKTLDLLFLSKTSGCEKSRKLCALQWFHCLWFFYLWRGSRWEIRTLVKTAFILFFFLRTMRLRFARK